MRQIKFRAWDGKEMHYPRVIFKSEDYEKKLFFSYDHGDVWCVTHDSLNESSVTLWVGSTIMQFTGLLDKDGKEIYEGDIIKAEHKAIDPTDDTVYVATVTFSHGCFMFTGDEPDENHPLGDLYVVKMEVIGNIHEHPHLLSNQAKG